MKWVLTPKQREALRIVSEGRFYPVLVKEDDGWHARWRPVGVSEKLALDGWVDEYVRQAAMTRLTEDAEDQKHETLHDAWMMALKSRTGLVLWDEDECRAFAAELEDWSGSAEEDVETRKSLVFRFCPPAAIALDEIPRSRRALKALGQAAYVYSPLRSLKSSVPQSDLSRAFLRLPLTPSEVEDFIHFGARALMDAGYTVDGLPERAVVTATAVTSDDAASRNALTHGDFKAAFSLTIHVNGQPVSAEEIRFLLDQKSTLVFFREHWIEVDRNILKEALRALEKGAGKKSNLLAFAMGIGRVGNLEIEELKAHGWLRGLLNSIRASPSVEDAQTTSFVGALRPYQQHGVAWIKFLTDHGFGALLADDMGLGKTIQTIAWLAAQKPSASPSAPALIVAPLTLLANWRREFAAFAPSLSVYVHQGDTRHFAGGFRKAASESDVVLTSYNLLVKDYVMFSEVAWDALVLDEAQAIKNPDTQVARAVKALMPPKRLALTGTPIENTIRDVWALEDFLNPDFLGDRKSFNDRFVKPLAYDPNCNAGKKLSHALEPFIMRRLKTDRSIAAELGDKREIREYCVLDAKAQKDYEAALASFRATEHTQGDVFALITELKLICDGQAKIDHLISLLETIFAAGESALIFTQYAKVGSVLQKTLQQHFSKIVPFLHGELSAAKREGEIRKFNRLGPQAFILSLKAGGYGLNLTKATHVIHFDRWWNPAVENQATDRAYRIGQNRDVMVHLMITEGTIEERVDELLRKKSSLTDILKDGQSFWEVVKLV